MPIQDDRTTNFSLKKPYPTNLLADDVARLREALDAIDAALNARPTSTVVQGQVDAAVAALVAAAPSTLNTLNELAEALGDDPNFATTMTNALAARLLLAGGTMTGALTLAGAPTSNLHAATKAYVDSAAAAAQAAADSKASLGLAIALG